MLTGADAVVFAAGAGPGSGAARKDTVDRARRRPARRRRRAGRRAPRTCWSPRWAWTRSPTARPREGMDEVFVAYLRAKLRRRGGPAARPGLRHDGAAARRADRRPGHRPGDPRHGTSSRGSVPRDDVAAVLVALLDAGAVGAVLELVGGPDPDRRGGRRAALAQRPAGAGDRRPGGELAVGRVVDPHQREAVRRAPPGRRRPARCGRAARPATPAARRPSPTASSAPTRLRTIEWQKASAEAATVIRSPSRATSSASSVRIGGGALAAAAEGGEVLLARAAARRPAPSRRRRARAASRRCPRGAAAAARTGASVSR